MQDWLTLHQSATATYAELYLFSEIDAWFGIGKDAFKNQVLQSGATDLTLHISSPGGNVDDALAMYDFLQMYPGKVTARLSGVVASAATVVALGASQVHMSPNALFMIHNVWGVSVGDAGQMRRDAATAEKFNERLVSIYSRKTGMSAEAIRGLMDAETWMSAEEAKTRGFIDHIIEQEKPQPQQMLAYKDLQGAIEKYGFRNCPQSQLETLYNLPPMETHHTLLDVIQRGFTELKNLFTNRPAMPATPKQPAASASAFDEEKYRAKVTELESQFHVLRAENESLTAAQEAAAILEESHRGEIEKLRNEVSRLKARGIDQAPPADPSTPYALPDKWENIAKELAHYARTKRN